MRRTLQLAGLCIVLARAPSSRADEPALSGRVASVGFAGDVDGVAQRVSTTTAHLAIPLESVRLTAEWDVVVAELDGDRAVAWTSPYLGAGLRSSYPSSSELELGTVLPIGSSQADDHPVLLASSALTGGRSFVRSRTSEWTLLARHRHAWGVSNPLLLESELEAGVAIPVEERGDFGVPLQASLLTGWRTSQLRVTVRAIATIGLGQQQDAHLSLAPSLGRKVGPVDVALIGTANLAGAYGSTFSGDAWSAGIMVSLPSPASLRGRVGQCRQDSECGHGYRCRIVPACPSCDGGYTQCVEAP